MANQPLWKYIRQLKRPIFTTRELSALSGKSLSSVTQALNCLERQGLVIKLCRGVWGEAGNEQMHSFAAVPFLFPRSRAYVSFISALHAHGIIEQIPQFVTLASTTHSRKIRTKLGVYSVHQIAPSFFRGFDWYKGTGSFLMAEPEKALIDGLYLSTRRKKQYAEFPELFFTSSFSFKKAEYWAKEIPDNRIRAGVIKKLKAIGMTGRSSRPASPPI
ncbi:MAG: hypothetical protein HY922_10390 [Elusimicrobia bacterium]|nr:hypothetical protein [Elusimicrobiota bacterium]